MLIQILIGQQVKLMTKYPIWIFSLLTAIESHNSFQLKDQKTMNSFLVGLVIEIISLGRNDGQSPLFRLITLGKHVRSMSTTAASPYSLKAAAFLLICSASALALASIAQAWASPFKRIDSAWASASNTTRWRWASANFSSLYHETIENKIKHFLSSFRIIGSNQSYWTIAILARRLW